MFSATLFEGVEEMPKADRDYLDKFLETLHKQTRPEAPEDEFFEEFCTEQVLKRFDLELDELASGRVRGPGDGGIDSAFLFANRKLVREDTDPKEFDKQEVTLQLFLIQSTRKAKFEHDAIRKFADVTNDLLDPSKIIDKQTEYNASLREFAKRFRTWWNALILHLPKLEIFFYYATKGDLVDVTLVKRAEKLDARILELFPSNCSSRTFFVNAKQLLESARTSKPKSVALKASEVLSSSNKGEASVYLVPIKSFADFITGEDGQLREYIFESNVRGYQGEKGVNAEIRASLDNPGVEEFWWLNNGVTILASKVTGSTKNPVLTEPQIVNGLQTSREIFNHSQTRALSNEDRHILVRVIQTTDKKVADRIIKTTNSQTRIPDIYLHSTEDIHRNIELAFPSFGLFYERRKNFYRDQGKRRSQIVTLPYLTQALIAIAAQEPDEARARPTTYAGRKYYELFSADDPPEFYAKSAILMKRVDEFLAEQRPPLDRSDQYNLRFHVAMFMGALLTAKPTPTHAELASIDLSAAKDKLLVAAFDHVYAEFRKQSQKEEPDQVARGKPFVERLRQDLTKPAVLSLGSASGPTQAKRAKRR